MDTSNKKLTTIFDENPYDLKEAAKKSRGWFEQQVLLLTRQRLTPRKVLKNSGNELKARVLPGHMYMFMYNPKLREELPYYDRFPLVLPFARTESGFIGLNLHYLPQRHRAILLDRLMALASNKKMDETTRIKYSWQLIDGVSRFRFAKPCVKQYLSDHVRSQFRRIDASQWATAVMLPVEQFVGSNKRAVWQDSMRKIR